ncbi:cadherin-23-like isoform X3 [Physella acuta]|uniref:cadherin-23-like isoform X3 n=1 Tax=Physella acuta TaxID=109671 RepID=UPI0027DDA10D|nr:cadherin-23-like isoform X3 [Physella acuta]
MAAPCHSFMSPSNGLWRLTTKVTWLLQFLTVAVIVLQVTGNSPPQPGTFARNLVWPEDTPIGTVIGNITASDADDGQVLYFNIDTADAKDLVNLSSPRSDPTNSRTKVVDIILKSQLDRDYAPPERKLYFSISDTYSSIPVEITLFIMDVNDVAPKFVNLPYEVTVKEDVTNGTIIFTGVSAFDPDNGRNIVFTMESNAQAADEEYISTFRIDQFTGKITLERPLDYEKHSYYQFKIMAEDEGHLKAQPVGFVVYVLDVQDTAPNFVNLPYSVQIDEDAPMGQSIQKVVAVDGDKGIPNSITYSFLSGDSNNFNLDSTTGIITIKKPLDRDSDTMKATGGVYAMIVLAAEVVPAGQVNKGETTATTLVTITVRDVNDNAPTFSQSNYNATILENMQQGVPVSFQGNILQVSDIDQGTNSHFALTLEKNGAVNYDFSPLPQQIYSESSVLIRVNNSAVLDYEKNKIIIFQIVAREMETKEKRSSSATVTLYIEDMNDNAPLFAQANYTFSVFENTAPGTPVQNFTATDIDSDIYGTKSIRYSLRGGNGKFTIDPVTGTLKVSGSIDREENNQFYLSVEAKDGGGLRTPAEVVVTVLDMNDNSPVFVRDDYEGIIKEGSLQFIRQLKVQASDEDEPGTNNSLVSYRISHTPPNLSSNFTIGASTGVITVTNALDYEKLSKDLNGVVTLTIEAFDAGNPVLSSSVAVNVTVEDVNDFTPVFSKSLYTQSVLENVTEDFLVITVNASDLDGTSPNKDFIYRIESGALDKFKINFETGELRVDNGAELDRETKDEYTLVLSAIDRGTPPRTGSSTLKITLLDVNDEVPVFKNPSVTIELSENTAVSTTVYSFTALDPDLKNKLKYRLGEVAAVSKDKIDDRINVTSTGVKYYFGINAETGDVFVNSTLDRETATKIVLQVIVEDVNAETGKQTATATLTVILLDYNDNPPKFLPSSNYTAEANEDEELFFIVLQVSATDADESQTISYSIGASTVDAFTINNEGTVQLKAKLDREKNDKVIFQIIAKDNGVPQLTSTATVTLRVLDANDNWPIFNPYNTTYTVLESEAVGYKVGVVVATDQDIGDYGTVFYTLEGIDNDGSFAINEKSGEISVSKALDRERKAAYIIGVIATDSKDDPTQQKSNHSQPITIKIGDVDDNPPQITAVIPERPSITETTPTSQPIASVVAVDADDKNTDNGRVIYSLTSDTNATSSNGTAFFSINSSSGIISPAIVLENHSGTFYITVKVTNIGQIFNATRKIFIDITDVNDNVPKFTRPTPGNTAAFISENVEVGTSVFQLEAVDGDTGPNGEMRFSIVPTGGSNDGSKLFAVHNITGLITTKAEINAEDGNMYQLKLVVQDLGTPIPFSSSVTMTIFVMDKNDHKPEFDGLGVPYQIGMVENRMGCVNLSLAIDKDLNINFTLICYYIIGSSLMDTFLMDTPSGKLCLNQTLDRESTMFINIVIQALDDCYKDQVIEKIYPFENGQQYPSMYRPSQTDKLWVEIEVQDVNDNPPLFKSKELTLGVTRVTQFGKFIMELKDDVEDKDSSRWGVDYFNATSAFTAHPEALKNELLGLGVIEPFKLFPNGSVKTNMYFKPQMTGFFTVDLVVYDKGGLYDTAKLRISLINDDQRLIIIFRRTIDTVGPIKEAVISSLSKKIGVRIIADSIQTHETDEGVADLAKTDMFIHGEDYETNEVVPVNKLLSLFDQKNALLIGLLNEYNVLQIVPAVRQVVDSGIEDKLKMAIILISVVLGITCIVLSIVLWYVNKRYKRKLKAATAMAYINSGVAPNDSDLYKADIPGTHIHSYENANPIFLEKIMLDSHDDGLSLSELYDPAFTSQSTIEDHEMPVSLANGRQETKFTAGPSITTDPYISRCMAPAKTNSTLSSVRNDRSTMNLIEEIEDSTRRRDSGIGERSGTSGPSDRSEYTIYNHIYTNPKQVKAVPSRPAPLTRPNNTSTLKNGSSGSKVACTNGSAHYTIKPAPHSKPWQHTTNNGQATRGSLQKEMDEMAYRLSVSSDEVSQAYSDFRNGLHGSHYGSSVDLTDL